MKTQIKILLLLFIGIAIVISGCKKKEDSINVIDITTDSAISSIVGNGNSKIHLRIYISDRTEESKRSINLSCNIGSFDSSSGTKAMVKSTFTETKIGNDWKYVADVDYLVPAVVGQAVIVAEIEGVTDTMFIDLTRLEASAIEVSAPWEVKINYLSEIVVTGTLKSSNGVPSAGIEVMFEDRFEASGQPVVNSMRRDEHYTSNENGKVSFTYSPGPHTPGQYIVITGTVLDNNGQPTTIKNSTRVYLNNI